MSQEKDDVFIEHMLAHIQKIHEFSRGLTQQALEKDELRQYAIIRAIEIIGEAAKNMSAEFKDKHQDIPWKAIIGTRDIMIHHYFGVDLDVVYTIITKDLPALDKKLKKAKRNSKKLH